mgnify:CR=1 FL=1
MSEERKGEVERFLQRLSERTRTTGPHLGGLSFAFLELLCGCSVAGRPLGGGSGLDRAVRPALGRSLLDQVHPLGEGCRLDLAPQLLDLAVELEGLRPVDGGRRKGVIEVDADRVEVRKDGVPVPMTRSEFLVFRTLASRPVRTWSRDDIIRAALGDDYDGFDRTVDTYVKNIRKKLAEPGHENGWIRTVYGFGYRLDDAEEPRP